MSPTSRIGFNNGEVLEESLPLPSTSADQGDPDDHEMAFEDLCDIVIDDDTTFDEVTEDTISHPSNLSPLYPIPESSCGSFFPKHHGPSRNHLLQLKAFWTMREEGWAYDGVLSPGRPRSSSPPPGLQPTTSTPSTSPKRPPPPTPITMHPRRGDILALRDPYCAQIDRCFSRLPLWTMSKTLFMFDLHVACKLTPSPSSEDADTFFVRHPTPTFDEEEAEEDGSVYSSMSTGDSSDSDMTLVDSDSGDDLSPVDPENRIEWREREGPAASSTERESWDVVSLTDEASPSCSSSPSASPDKQRQQAPHITTYISQQSKAAPAAVAPLDLSQKARPRLLRHGMGPPKRQATDTTMCSEERSKSFSEDDDEAEEEEEEEDYMSVLLDEEDPFGWSKNWYRRWDLLTRLVRADQTRKRGRTMA